MSAVIDNGFYVTIQFWAVGMILGRCEVCSLLCQNFCYKFTHVPVLTCHVRVHKEITLEGLQYPSFSPNVTNDSDCCELLKWLIESTIFNVYWVSLNSQYCGLAALLDINKWSTALSTKHPLTSTFHFKCTAVFCFWQS